MPLINNATITRRRFAAGTRGTDGRFTNGATTDTTGLAASVQGPSGNDLQTLPEGDRTKEVRKVYLDVDVRTSDQHTGTLADHLLIDGVAHEVRKVWPWRAGSLIPHHKCLAVRLQEVAP